MKTKHLKSPCCQEKIQHFGGKRRKCSKCKKTWTVRPKKRGRKQIRRFSNPVKEIILNGTTVTAWAKRRNIAVSTASEQIQRHLRKFIKEPLKLNIPNGPYVLLADGLWFTFKKQDWVLFLTALKPISENKAYFLDPILLPGGESYENWTKAIATIPANYSNQLKAFVSDGFRTSKRISFEQHLIHQRCQFHLIAYLQVRRGYRKKLIAGKSIRESIYKTVIKMLRLRNTAKIKSLSNYLRLLAKKSDCPKSMKMTVAEFLRALPEFLAYLKYPGLNLPATTGSVEAMCKLIRKRTRAIRTAAALKLWATAIVRIKSPLTCNKKNFQQN